MKFDNVVIVKETNIMKLEMVLNDYFEKGYTVVGGVSQFEIGSNVYYCVIVTKPF